VDILAKDEAGAAFSNPMVATPDLVQRGMCDHHLVVDIGDGGSELRVLDEFEALRVGVETRKGRNIGLIKVEVGVVVVLEVGHGDVKRVRKRCMCDMLWL